MAQHIEPAPRSESRAPEGRAPEHRIANAIFLRISGGPLRAYSILRHTGRRSGREFVTPLSAYPLGDGFVLAVLYGKVANIDWCQNVISAGGCVLRTLGQEIRLERPEVIGWDQAIGAFPPLIRFVYRRQGITEFMWLHQPAGR